MAGFFVVVGNFYDDKQIKMSIMHLGEKGERDKPNLQISESSEKLHWLRSPRPEQTEKAEDEVEEEYYLDEEIKEHRSG